MTALRLALLALLAAPAAADDDDEQIVARGGPVVLTRGAFADWLVDRVGHLHVADCLDELLVLRAAEEAGRSPTDARVAAEAAHQREQVIEQYFRGDEERYLEDLRRKGLDPARHEERRLEEVRFSLCLAALAADEREIDEEQLRARYRDIYGELGERVSLDVLFYSAYHGLQPGGERPALEDLKAAAMSRARVGARGLADGLPVSELLHGSDPVSSEFVEDGRIARYRKRMLGPEVERAVQSLDDPGDVTPVVPVWDGAYVLRLVDREPVTFEEARPELEQMLRDAPPTSAELSAARNRVLQAVEREIFLR